MRHLTVFLSSAFRRCLCSINTPEQKRKLRPGDHRQACCWPWSILSGPPGIFTLQYPDMYRIKWMHNQKSKYNGTLFTSKTSSQRSWITVTLHFQSASRLFCISNSPECSCLCVSWSTEEGPHPSHPSLAACCEFTGSLPTFRPCA